MTADAIPHQSPTTGRMRIHRGAVHSGAMDMSAKDSRCPPAHMITDPNMHVKKKSLRERSRRLKDGVDLLSHFRSTIGAIRFNFSVRNGKRWIPYAVDA